MRRAVLRLAARVLQSLGLHSQADDIYYTATYGRGRYYDAGSWRMFPSRRRGA